MPSSYTQIDTTKCCSSWNLSGKTMTFLLAIYTVKIRMSMQHPNFTMNAQGCSDYTHEKLKVL